MPNTAVNPDLKGFTFDDYRQDIWGDSFNWDFVRGLDQIIKLAIHHSVTDPKPTDSARSQADVIAASHEARGWAGIGYHFVIAKDGTVLYVGDIGTGRANITNNNEKIIGICLVGDFTKELPTQEQICAANYLCEYLLTERPDIPNVNTWDDVIGHKDAIKLWPTATATECPGNGWGAEGDNLHDRLRDLHTDGYPRFSTSSPVPKPTQPTPPATPTPPTTPTETPKPPVVPTPPVTPVETNPTPPSVPTPPVVPTPPAKPPVETTPPVAPTYQFLVEQLQTIHDVLYGKGFWWTKIWKLKQIFEK